MNSIFIGWDPAETEACEVARASLMLNLRQPIPIHQLVLQPLRSLGLYTRPTKHKNGRLIDLLSVRGDYDGSISTEHAISRFLVPHLARTGWAMFADGDVLFRGDVSEVFDGLDKSKALYCVKHDYNPLGTVKKAGAVQTQYNRKNWSSVMIFNCDHELNHEVIELVNTVPGRDLHEFCWLDDDEIGELDPCWNYLVGHHTHEQVPNPRVVHFTEGLPNIPGYEMCDYADEWAATRARILGQRQVA